MQAGSIAGAAASAAGSRSSTVSDCAPFGHGRSVKAILPSASLHLYTSAWTGPMAIAARASANQWRMG